ncbi:MAG: DEAD/DEAH box helicase family protein [Candidatus Moeniiplasma glomeromycotorum]|nr:DEAD/DEAH box helicase family protein [Candidatus Moeniiplasma glomeromycotorum]MCE8162496.1 DEAD/DEAH box helicase family protein [Candidatus Moeniiplasma glomeromycotorum]MCE8166423.1 DEAD/DEAH box helicase family protein [Candidatus Moeniiplasma glomeromycotorum]MCE8166908.1 DEAD/DEAH box helicase family protein [Candidatus Moeniiplasma glomeromycotorum]
MPQTEEKVTKKEFEKTIKDLLDLNDDNLKNIKVDGKPLGQIIKEQNDKINELEQENTKLKQEKVDKEKMIEILKDVFGEKNFEKDKEGKVKYTGTAGSNTSTSSPAGPIESKPSEPSAPTEAQIEEQAWETFFTGKSITDKEAWKLRSGLKAAEAKGVWDNGWQDLTTNITNLGSKQMTYTSNGQTTDNVELLKHQKDELDKVHKLIDEISKETDLTKLVKEENISTAYAESKVPIARSYVKVKELRGNKVKELFKKAFEQPTSSGLSDEQIELWRTTTGTGLSGNGTEERKAFDNQWKNPDDIKNKQISAYSSNKKETKNIDVLKVNKSELDKVHDILVEIDTKKTFFELPVNYKGEKHKIADLNYSQLPDNTKKVIADAIQNQRNTFIYKVNVENNENKGDGLTPQSLTDALKEITTNKKEPQKYGSMTADFLTNFLKASDLKTNEVNDKGELLLDKQKNPITKPVKIEGNTIEDLDEPNEALYGVDKDGNPRSWLQYQGAFKLPKEMTDEEDALDLKTKGIKLLEHFYKENNYDPNKPTFCNFVEKDEKKDIPVQPKLIDGKPNPEAGAPIDKSGLLAIATGVGKTTKTINCLVNGGQRNVVLICPTGALCASAADHHAGWLQTWGCVVHKELLMKDGKPVMEEVENPITKEKEMVQRFKSHGTYPVKLNDLVYYENNKGEVQGSKGLSVLETWALLSFLTRKLWSTKQKGEKKSGMELVLERIKIMKSDQWIEVEKERVNEKGEKVKVKVKELAPGTGKESYTKWVAEAVSKFIPKGTIIVFDEAHFGQADYQTLIKQVIFLTKEMGFEVLKMSATFKGIPFSSTSTFPRKNLYMSSIIPKFKLGGEEINLDELLKKNKLWLFLPDAERGLNDAQKKLLKDHDIAHVVFNQPFEKFCESISFGMPPSSLMIVDGSKEMGFTPDIDIVVLANITETSNLKTNWEYSTPNSSWISLASFAQQIGRAARIKNGMAITVSKELEEFVIKPEVSVYVIQAALSADSGALVKMKAAGFNDVNHLRGSIALATEENRKWGLYPAELVVGASDGTAAFPKWGKAKQSFRVDRVLMEKHDGIWEAPKLDKKSAKDIMDLMISTYIKQRKSAEGKKGEKNYKGPNNFPYILNVEMKSSLIEAYGLDPQDVKKVLNGIIEERLKELEVINKIEFKADEKAIFEEVVSLYRLALGVEAGKGVTVSKEVGDDKKEFWVMRIKYAPVQTRTLGITEKVEELQTIRVLLYKHNLQLYENEVGEEVRQVLEKNTLEGYQDIITRLQSSRLGNILIAHMGHSNAMNLVFEMQAAMKKILTKKKNLPEMTEQQKVLCNDLYQKFEQKMDDFNLRDFKDYSVDLGYSSGYQSIKTELDAISDFNQYQQRIKELTTQLYQKANEQAVKDGNAVEEIPAELASDNNYQAQILDTSKK